MKYWIVLLLSTIGIGLSACSNATKKPNIILIMTDDQGWFDIGFNGNTEIQTPWLDSLAAKGIIFDRFYAGSAVCSPTRASFITGRNPLRMNIPYANSGHMPKEEITLSEILKREHYATAHFGKWHLGTLTKTAIDANRGGREKFEAHYTLPTDHGYDSFFCTESKVPTYDPMVLADSFIAKEGKRYGWRARTQTDSISDYGTAYWLGEDQKESHNLRGDDSRIIMDRVIPFIEQSIAQQVSFFTTIWFHTPHLPVVSDSIHRSLYRELPLDKQLYYGTITALDEQIGRLWRHLEDRGIADETILFFCSDNGPERQTPGSAGIFRARKRSLYEGGLRVPAFVIWENHLESGQRLSFPAVTSDYLPTILDLLNLDFPDQRPIDGISLWGLINAKQRERLKPIGFICKPQISWVTDQYKLIGDDKRESFELYDLIADPAEEKNIIAQYPSIAANMKADLFAWLQSVENSSQGKDYH